MKNLTEYLTESSSINEAWNSRWDDVLDYLLDDMDPEELQSMKEDDPGELFDWMQGQLEDSDDSTAKSFARALSKNDPSVIKHIQDKVDELLAEYDE